MWQTAENDSRPFVFYNCLLLSFRFLPEYLSLRRIFTRQAYLNEL